MSSGSLFHKVGVADENARSPKVFLSLVLGDFSNNLLLDLRWLIKSAIYSGTGPYIALKVKISISQNQ